MKSLPEILKEIRPEFDFAASNDFMADGMLDSFDMVTLVAALDKNYAISIPGTDILPEHFQNLKTIEALLRKSGAKLE
jgi:acyl carrier protein